MAKIVLADDDDDLRTIYCTALRAGGYEVWDAPDGKTALELVHAHHPDLLLLDIWMPTLNGFEVLDALRHDPSAVRLRTVVISNLADADTRLEAFEGGIAEYLVKGLSLDAFLRRVGEVLSMAEVAQLGDHPTPTQGQTLPA